MAGLRNFYDLLDECRDYSKNLLLGNGFSVAHSDVFCYDSILKESSFCTSRLFQNTSDYEKVIEGLNFQRDVFQQAYDDYVTATMLEDLGDELKWDLIHTLVKIHDKVYIDDKANHNTFLFLSNFSNIFTLNYDLLLYWVINYAVELYRQNKSEYYSIVGTDKFYPCDGFDKKYNEDDCIWCEDRWPQNIFYLHGGLHLFCNSENTYKLTYNVNNKQTIIQKTKYWLEQGTSPLIIIEGNSFDKLNWIKRSHYLNYCYEKLSKIHGVVFVHGHSLDENDQHIFNAINANQNIKAVYISIFDPIKNEERIRDNAKRRINNRSLNVEFYNAQSVALW